MRLGVFTNEMLERMKKQFLESDCKESEIEREFGISKQQAIDYIMKITQDIVMHKKPLIEMILSIKNDSEISNEEKTYKIYMLGFTVGTILTMDQLQTLFKEMKMKENDEKKIKNDQNCSGECRGKGEDLSYIR
jgi:hypothetical protein